MGIDSNYREYWKNIGKHNGHSVWISREDSSDQIHGTIVGVHLLSCNGCMGCISACPTNVFDVWEHEEFGVIIDPISEEDCILCYVCETACPTDAIHIRRESGSDDTLESLLRGVQ